MEQKAAFFYTEADIATSWSQLLSVLDDMESVLADKLQQKKRVQIAEGKSPAVQTPLALSRRTYHPGEPMRYGRYSCCSELVGATSGCTQESDRERVNRYDTRVELLPSEKLRVFAPSKAVSGASLFSAS